MTWQLISEENRLLLEDMLDLNSQETIKGNSLFPDDYSGDIGPLFWSIWGHLQFSRFHSKSA